MTDKIDSDLSFDPNIIIDGDPHRIWLGCLPTRTTEYAILQLAKQFGDLADFHFPVHKSGDLQGSTIGYCFLTYKSVSDAKKAWKALDRLNFHGNLLVARPARPTKDEISLAQRVCDEAVKLRIIEEAKEREKKLAALLTNIDEDDNTNITNITISGSSSSSGHKNQEQNEDKTVEKYPIVNDEKFLLSNLQNSATSSLNPNTNPHCYSNSSGSQHLNNFIYGTDLYGKLGRVSSKTNSTNSNNKQLITSGGIVRPKQQQFEAKAAIRRIEMALKKLDETPIGGTDSLKPIAFGQNPFANSLILKSSQNNNGGSSSASNNRKKCFKSSSESYSKRNHLPNQFKSYFSHKTNRSTGQFSNKQNRNLSR